MAREFGEELSLLDRVVGAGRAIGVPEELYTLLATNPRFFQAVKALYERVTHLTKYEQLAIEILGRQKVVPCSQALLDWKEIELITPPAIPFAEATLRQCAKENRKGRDWRLVFTLGFSLREQFERHPNCFEHFRIYGEWRDWWVLQKPLVDNRIEPGYRLLDLKVRFSQRCPPVIYEGKDPFLGFVKYQAKVATEISKLGKKSYGVAETPAVSESIISFHLATGKFLLRDKYHLGDALGPAEDHIVVGHTWTYDEDGSNGIRLCTFEHYFHKDDIGVVLARKPDF